MMAGKKKKSNSMILYVPRAERPVVPVHCVGELARFGTSQCVAHEAVRVESGSVRRAVCGRKNNDSFESAIEMMG